MMLLKFVLSLVVASILSSCATFYPSAVQPKEQGIQPSYVSFVPARIAVLSCQDTSSIAATSKDALSMCDVFDQFVLKSFDNQPYMNGFTPKLVKQYLEKAGHKDHLSHFKNLWSFATPDASSEEFVKWLNRLSISTKYADALLVPVLLKIEEKEDWDRGLKSYKHIIHAALVLIDTNSQKVIWWRERQGVITKLTKEDRSLWEDVAKNTFIPQFMEGFPGRLELDYGSTPVPSNPR